MEKPDSKALETLESALREAEIEKEDAEKKADQEAEAKGPAPDSPEAKLAETEKALAECKDKTLRAMAELDNFRKRSAKDVQAAYASGAEAAIFPILKLFDVFELALKSAREASDMESVRKGLEMLRTDFARIIGELGIQRIEDATGKDFNPAVHEAVSQAPSESVPAGKVMTQLSCGYKRGDRLVKAAQVIVSSGPQKNAGQDGSPSETA